MGDEIIKFSEHRVRHDKTMERLAEILAKSERLDQSVESELTSAQMEVVEISRIVLELMAFQKVFADNGFGDGFYQARIREGKFFWEIGKKCWKFSVSGNSRVNQNIIDKDLCSCVAWADGGEVFVRRAVSKTYDSIGDGFGYVTTYSAWERLEGAALNWRNFDGAGLIKILKLMVATCEQFIDQRDRAAKERQNRLNRDGSFDAWKSRGRKA